MKKKINDWLIRFTNINGSGSASANKLFAKSIFRMGVPVGAKNIFPSNIQGLPTWYEVRVSEKGFLGKKNAADFAVALNGKTLKKDYLELASGGYFFYDSTRPLPEHFRRKDIHLIPIPLTELAHEAFAQARLQEILKNIIYVGALVYLLDIDYSVVSNALLQQFAKKPKVADKNIQALKIGFNYAKEHFPETCHLSVQAREGILNDEILVDGNTAIGLGAVFAGATVTGWYPITPSTSVIEAFEKYCSQFRKDEKGKNKVAIIQAEDELAALGMVIGAQWNGARAFTATSGPGISLMAEFVGLAYFAEIPAVIVDVQRAGPSTGMPTRGQQSDILAAAFASHGDTKHPVFFPATPKDCFDMTIQAFDLADRLQSPVFILSDLDLGMNDHISKPFEFSDEYSFDRGKILNHDDLENMSTEWGRYLDIDGDGICYRTYPGTHPNKGAYFTRGTSHNEFSGYTEDNVLYEKNLSRLLLKWETARKLVPPPIINRQESPLGLIYFGTSLFPMQEALAILAEKNCPCSAMQITAFPFHQDVQDFIDEHKHICIIEQNRDGQMHTLLNFDCTIKPTTTLHSILHYDGLPLSADKIVREVENIFQEFL